MGNQIALLIVEEVKRGGIFDIGFTAIFIFFQVLILVFILDKFLYTPVYNSIEKRNIQISKRFSDVAISIIQIDKLEKLGISKIKNWRKLEGERSNLYELFIELYLKQTVKNYNLEIRKTLERSYKKLQSILNPNNLTLFKRESKSTINVSIMKEFDYFRSHFYICLANFY